MSKNEFSFGEEFDLGNNFKVAVGDRVPLTSLKKAVEACQGRHNVRLFTADAPIRKAAATGTRCGSTSISMPIARYRASISDNEKAEINISAFYFSSSSVCRRYCSMAISSICASSFFCCTLASRFSRRVCVI